MRDQGASDKASREMAVHLAEGRMVGQPWIAFTPPIGIPGDVASLKPIDSTSSDSQSRPLLFLWRPGSGN